MAYNIEKSNTRFQVIISVADNCDCLKCSLSKRKSKRSIFSLLLLFSFLSLFLTESQAVLSKQELKAMLADPNISNVEKKRKYMEYIVSTNPRMATAMENPTVRASIENSFEAMLAGMTTIGITSNKNNTQLNDKEKQERAAAYNQFLNQINNKNKAVQVEGKRDDSQYLPASKNNTKLKDFGSWRFAGVSTDLRSKYTIKNASLGESTSALAKRLVNDDNYSPVYADQQRGIKLQKDKKLADGHYLHEILHLHTHDKVPDIVTSIIYVLEPGGSKGESLSKVDLSLDQLKDKLSAKYGQPLSYKVVMKPSRDAAQDKIEKVYLKKKSRCENMRKAITPHQAKVNYDSCIDKATKLRDDELANIDSQLRYQDCLDWTYDKENYGSCLLHMFSEKSSGNTDQIYLPSLRSSFGQVSKGSDGSALIHNKCYAWAESGESILLCPERSSYVVKLISNNIYNWVSGYVKKEGNKRIKADIDL